MSDRKDFSLTSPITSSPLSFSFGHPPAEE